MRVCLITTTDVQELGGLQWSLRRIADILVSLGYLVDIVQLDAYGIPGRGNFDIPGVSRLTGWRPEVTVWRVQRLIVDPFRPRASAQAMDFHFLSLTLERLIRVRQYDVLHAFALAPSGFITGQVAKRASIPVLVSARGSDLHIGTFSSAKLPQIRWTLAHADLLTFVNREMLELADSLTECKSRSIVVMNSTSDAFFHECEVDRGLQLEGFIIGGAGKLSLKKNPYELLLTCARLRKLGVPAHILWIGEIFSLDQPYIDEWIKELELVGHVTFIGPVAHETILNYLQLLHVYVSTALDEGFPNAVLEAMLVGRPIVAYAVGALPDLIQHDKDGILVTPALTDDMVRALSELWLNPMKAVNLGASARKRVVACLNVERERLAWADCYARIERAIR